MKSPSWLHVLAIGVGVLLSAETNWSRADEKPKPPYEVKIEQNVPVRLRDGVALAADVYVPIRDGRPVEGKLPAVLHRTPYNKSGAKAKMMATFFAQHGYLSVVQDCRGRHASEGEYAAFPQEAKDGYDTIAWLARHPSCNGKVGMYGCSYGGWVQLQAATQHPPALVTMIPFQGPINAYHYSMHVGGAVHFGLLKWVFGQAGSSHEAKKDPALGKAIAPMADRQGFLRWASRTPWKKGQTPLSALPRYENIASELFFDHPDYDDFWRQPSLAMDEHFANYPEIPILWVGGWFDWYPRSMSDGYQKMVALKRKNQYLLMGPWTHDNFNSGCGEVDFGFGGSNLRSYDDYLQLERRWFDRWLKGDADADIGKPVSVFVMGGGDGKRRSDRLSHGGEWHHGDTWPPAGAKLTNFYLHAKGGLSRETPEQKSASTSYTYDPRNTVSSNGRCFVPYLADWRPGGMGPRDQVEFETLPGHGLPGMPIASRPDVLVYQTKALATSTRIAGNVKMILHISSDAPDTDFFVKLLDVYPPSADYPAGFALPLCDGVLRARYRDSFSKPTLLKSGEVYRLEFPLEPTANLFQAGHRIRIDVTSSNFPGYDINRNTGDPGDRRWRLANNTVWHDQTRASCIVLPLMEP
jgi:putative CocE/NonD family hydrolase